MAIRNMKQKSVRTHDFSMIPRADIPRSSFRTEKMLKTAFSAGYLIPIYCEEVLPGDTFNITAHIVCRTPPAIVPFMDNWTVETFYFFEPNRLVWQNWIRFMGEQDSPGDSTAYTIPQMVSPAGGYAVGSLHDYFGLPTAGQVLPGSTVTHSALPLRAYNHIWNQWFRDQNLQNSTTINVDQGPDNYANYGLQKRGKRPDYFTSALPFVQKGTSVSLPLGTTATVRTSSTELLTGVQPALKGRFISGAVPGVNSLWGQAAGNTNVVEGAATGLTVAGAGVYPTNLYADLSTATAATINQLRQSFQIQKLLERDARGGTRYTELVRAHFGVISPDARLQRPEYLGGGRIPIITNAIPQTSATGLTGATTPIGTLAATGHAQGNNGFTYAATEHGHIIGLISVRAEMTYQQGMRRLWSRQTRYDHYFPVFAMLGEQPVYNKEIYCDGSANDDLVFGYQERWAEYRYNPSQITGIFRSTAAGTIDYWHSAQRFTTLPTLNATFIADNSDITIQRNLSGGAQTAGQQFYADILFSGVLARPLPMYSVPGMVDHF